MEIKDIEAFYAVAKYGSVTRAAQSLSEAQPTISKRLKSFEQSTGGDLFFRNRRPLQLTPLGEKVFGATGPLVRSLDNLRFVLDDEVKHQPINFMATYPVSEDVLSRAVERFRHSHPETHLRVQLGTLAEVAATVDRGEVDFGLVHGDVPDHDFAVKDLGMYDRVLITPPDHPILNETTLDVHKIAEWPLISGPVGTYSREIFEHTLKDSGSRLESAIEVDNSMTIKRFVLMGFGLAVIPRLAMEISDYAKLGVRSLSNVLPNDSVRMLRVSNGSLNERAQPFIDLITLEVERVEAQIGLDAVGELVSG